MNILVTGSNGQLGNEVRILSTTSLNAYFFTDITTPEGVSTTILDITDSESVKKMVKENNIDVIINCAAYTNVDKAEEEPDIAHRINAEAVCNLARAAYENDSLLIHISTDYVFQGTGYLPYVEDEQTDPLGVYGDSKQAGEQAVISSGCRFMIFRTAWLYSSFGKNFVKTIIRLTKEKESINVVFDQVGTPTYAADLAAAIFDIIENGKISGNEGIYHYTNEGVCSWYDFAKEIAELTGAESCDISPCHSYEFPSKVRRPYFSVLDKTKYKKRFNNKIPYWKSSLKRCLKIVENQ